MNQRHPSRPRVLIVEDDQDLRGVYRVALAMAGYEVWEARDGLEALYQLDSNPPDIVLLDLGLPVISGAVVDQEIRTSAHGSRIAVIIVTGTEVPADFPGRRVLRKPVTPERLIEAVQSAIPV